MRNTVVVFSGRGNRRHGVPWQIRSRLTQKIKWVPRCLAPPQARSIKSGCEPLASMPHKGDVLVYTIGQAREDSRTADRPLGQTRDQSTHGNRPAEAEVPL
jgi:hypothetical protein